MPSGLALTAGVSAPAAFSPVGALCRLRAVAAANDCAILLATGPDSMQDAPSKMIIGSVLPADVGPAADDFVLLVTPRGAAVHCAPSLWASCLQSAFEASSHTGTDEPLDVQAFIPNLDVGKDDELELLDFKLEAVRNMLKTASHEASSGLAGFISLDEAVEAWPLLRAACLGSPGLVEAVPPLPDVAEQFVRAARGVCPVALGVAGWAGQGGAHVAAGWRALASKLNRVGDAYDRAELTERFLADTVQAAAAKAAAVPAAGDAAGVSASGVWAGTRTGLACTEPSKRRQMRISGAASNNALHAVVRIVDPGGSGVAAARSIFFSNGAVPHHWQHRVFSDGEVFDPIVEDEVPPVERAEETLRLMTLYGVLASAVRQAAAMAAAACPARVATAALNRMWYAKLSAAVKAKLLPQNFDVVEHGTLTVRRVLRPAQVGTGSQALDSQAVEQCGPEDDRDMDASRPTGATDDDDGTDGGKSPAQWYLHGITARLDGIPSLRWDPDVEGSLLYEDTFAIDGASGGTVSSGQRATPVSLTQSVPLLSCWPAEGAEESETRQVRGAVEQNNVCRNMQAGIERMRAGEHAQLQVLIAPPEDVIVLTSNPWMPVLQAELRLFSGGVCIDTPQHGPHVLPFRIHLAAAAYFQVDDRRNAGLILLRQKPDTHGYGPLALLPDMPGATGSDDEPINHEDPPLRTLSLAILVPPRSTLQDSLESIVKPAWAALFDECSIPCDELTAPPNEFSVGLGVLRAEGVLSHQ